MNESMAVETVKASPPVAVLALEWFGVTLSDAVLVLTAIYTILLIIGWFRRNILWRPGKREDPPCAQDCPVANRRTSDTKVET